MLLIHPTIFRVPKLPVFTATHSDRQYELVRVANAAIDIYSMAAVLSRCTYVIQNDGADAAKHDQKIAQLFVRQAYKRATANLNEASNPSVTGMRLIEEIATDVFDEASMVQKHPLEIGA